MPELRLRFPLAGGLHARPSAALRARALVHGEPVTWTNLRTGRSAALDSVLGLLATETVLGDAVRLEAQGPGAARTLADLDAFLRGAFLETDAPSTAPADGTGTSPRVLSRAGATWWPAVPVAPGIGNGPVHLLGPLRRPPIHEGPCVDPDAAIHALRQALEGLRAQVEAAARRAVHPAHRGILEAHAALLADAGWTGAMTDGIAGHRLGPSAAVRRATEAAARELAASPVPHMAERAEDLWDLAEGLLALLAPEAAPVETPILPEGCVAVAEHLPPSAFLALDHAHLQGLVLGEGSATSHTAILARSFGIPCIAGLPGARSLMRPGQPAVVDGTRGLLVTDPPAEVAAWYAVEREADAVRRARLAGAAHRPARTRDGHAVAILANLASPLEAEGAFRQGAEGIGLFRTEMLFLDRAAPPSEAEQADAYAQVLRAAQGRPVVLRLLDAGGDKPLPFLPLGPEPNPFLGRRGVRWYPDHPALVDTQLRAALRATRAGRLRLMVPMVSRPEELRAVRAQLTAAAEALRAEGCFDGPLPPLGMMVEVPAAALTLRAFTGLADFACVGTNDLIQYLFAADRGDAGLLPASRAAHPATLGLLDRIARDAASLGLELSLCGEMAGDPRWLPLLLGLGFTTLSAAPTAVPALKAAAAGLDLEACRACAADALRADSEAEVASRLEALVRPSEPPPLVAPELVILEAPCATKAEAIKRLVEQLALAGRTADPQALEEAVWAREDATSTAIGFGLAVPHAKVPGLGSGGLAVLRLAQDLDWEAPETGPVRTVMLLATPGDQEVHLRTFARLARRLMDPAFRAALDAAPTADHLARLLQAELTCS